MNLIIFTTCYASYIHKCESLDLELLGNLTMIVTNVSP